MGNEHENVGNRKPLGRGRIARRAFANPERLDSLPRGMPCSLSLWERARVRGNEADFAIKPIPPRYLGYFVSGS
jgi:hypothetical protein